jgi:hydroxyethylthiazole kinase-like uncharacterized protein yjeF
MYYATAKEMERLDALAVEHGLEIRQMMELAGWHMVSLFRKLQIPKEANITVIVGKGNKGGDGLSAVRHLVNHGRKVRVLMLDKKISEDSTHHLQLLEKMRVSIEDFRAGKEHIEESDILIDGLIGYHLEGVPRGVFAEAIEAMNASGKRIISYDLPSGVDPTTGKCFDPCVQAFATLSLAMPKKVFAAEEGKAKSGQVFVADIGIPNFVYDQISLGSRPVFDKNGGLIVL